MVGYAVWFIKCTEHLYEVINQAFKPYIGKFLIIYLDDISIFSKNEREYKDYLIRIMMMLEREKLYGNLKKCSFSPTRSLLWDVSYSLKELRMMNLRSNQFEVGPC